MKALTYISAILVTAVCSCCEDESAHWRIDRKLINELMNLSSEQITIGGTTLELHAYLWRDFMPVSPPNGKELISLNWLVDTDSVSIPGHITLSQQFVILGDSIWTADYTKDVRQPYPYVQERISRNGPKWGPGIEVTIVAKVVDQRDGAEFYLRRDNQSIERTD